MSQNQKQFISIGIVQINRKINSELISFIKQNLVELGLTNNQWSIDNWDAYIKLKWKMIFKHINESKGSTAKFCSLINPNQNKFQSSQIIKQIQHINFVDLQQLYLFKNKIDNIEPLMSMSFPKLKSLHLGYNKITRLNSINKWSTPSLKTMYLHPNCFHQISSLSRAQLTQFIIGYITLEFFQNSEIMNEDISVICKLNSKDLEIFYIKSQQRIGQYKVALLLEKRFPSIKIMKD